MPKIWYSLKNLESNTLVANSTIKKNSESLKQVETDYRERVSSLKEMEELMQMALAPLQELNEKRKEVLEEVGGKTAQELEDKSEQQLLSAKSMRAGLEEEYRFLASLGIAIDHDDIGISEENSATP